MFGVTNAQGVTGPELTERLNGYGQTLFDTLDEIREQLTDLRTKYERIRDNPRLGEIVNYAGFDWIVCHVDDTENLLYLAMKDIYEITKFSETGSTAFSASRLEERLIYFNDVLTIFSSGLVWDSGVSELEPVSFNGAVRYAFVPSYRQITETFDLFKGKRFGRLPAKKTGNPLTTTYIKTAYGTVSDDNVRVEHENYAWWTCTPGNHNNILTIDETGHYTAETTVSDPASQQGFRPFVCMKMR